MDSFATQSSRATHLCGPENDASIGKPFNRCRSSWMVAWWFLLLQALSIAGSDSLPTAFSKNKMEVENNDEEQNYIEVEVSPSAPPMRLLNMFEIPNLTDASPEDEIEFLSNIARLYRQQKTIRDKCCTVLQLRLWFNNFGTNRGIGIVATLAMELSLEACFPHDEDSLYPTWGKIVIEEAASRMSKNPRDLAHIFAQMLPQSAANQILRDPGNTYRIIRTYASTLDLDVNHYYDCFVQTIVRVCMTLFTSQHASAFSYFQRSIESFFADALEDHAVVFFPIAGTSVKRLVSEFFDQEYYKVCVALMETGNIQNELAVSMNNYVKTVCDGAEWYHIVAPKMEVFLLSILQIIGRENPTTTGYIMQGLAVMKKLTDIMQRTASAESGGGRHRLPRYGTDEEVARSLLGERFLSCLQLVNNFLTSDFEAPRQQKTDILNALTFFMQYMPSDVGLHVYKILMTLQIATVFYLELPNDLRLANALSDSWTELVKILRAVNKVKELGSQIVASMINILQLGGDTEIFARPVDLLIVKSETMTIMKELAFLPNMSVFGPDFSQAEQRLYVYRVQLSALCNTSRRITSAGTLGGNRAIRAAGVIQRGEDSEFSSVLFRINQLLNATETATSGMSPMEARNPSRASQLSPSRVSFKVTGHDLRRMLLERLATVLASCQDDIADILLSRDTAAPQQEMSGFRHIYDTLLTLLFIMHGVESREAVLVGMCLGWLGAVDPAKFALALPKQVDTTASSSDGHTLTTSLSANKLVTNPALCSGADEPEFFAQILVRALTSSYLGSTGAVQQDAACFALQEVLKLYQYQTAEVSKTIPEEFRDVLFPFISTKYELLDEQAAEHPFVRAANNAIRASSSSAGSTYTPVYTQTAVSTYSRWIRQWACFLIHAFKPADTNSTRSLAMKLFSKCLRALMLEDTRFCTNMMPWLLLHVVGDEAAPPPTSPHEVSMPAPSHEVPLGPNARNVLVEFATVLRSRIAPTSSQHVGNCIAQEAIMFVCNVLDFFRQYCKSHKPRSSASGDGRSNATGEVRSRVQRIGSFVNRISDRLLWEASFYTGSYARSLQFFEKNLAAKCRMLDRGWPSATPASEQQQQLPQREQENPPAAVYEFTNADREFFKQIYMRMDETDGIQGTLRLSVGQLRRDDEMILHRIAGKLDEGLVTLVSSYRGSRTTSTSALVVAQVPTTSAEAAATLAQIALPLRSVALTTNSNAAEAANIAAKSASAANDMDTLVQLLDCMVELEQFESALHWADSTNRERRQSHEQELLDKQYECLAMLGEWDKLAELAEAHPADDLASIQDGFARVYLAAGRGEALRFYHDAEQLRQYIVQRIRSDKCDSEPYYTRYENMLMLQSLQDVDAIGSYLFGFAAKLPLDLERQQHRRAVRIPRNNNADAIEVDDDSDDGCSDDVCDDEEDDDILKLHVADATDAYFLQLPATEMNNPVAISAETHRQQFMLSGTKINQLSDLDRILNQRSELITPSYDNLRLLMAPRRVMLSLAQSLASKNKLNPFVAAASAELPARQEANESMISAIQQSLSNCLLRLCRAARKASRQTNAYHLLINAELVCAKDAVGSVSDTSCACESAKWQWQNNMRESALNTLNQLNRRTFSLRMLPPAEKERRDACHFDMLDDGTRQAAKISLLCARYSDQLGYFDYNETRSMYAEVSRVFPQWHKAHYHVGRYQDDRLLMFSDAPSDSFGADASGANSSSSGQLGTLSNSALSDRMQDVYSIVESYLLSLRYGTRYVDRILPRLLTLFMDYGEEIQIRCDHVRNSAATAAASSSKSAAARNAAGAKQVDEHLAEAEVKMQELCTLMIDFTNKHLPVYVFYPAIQQLASRLSHPNPFVIRAIWTILSRCFFFYPSQTMWYLISTYLSSDPVRQQNAGHMYKFFLAEGRAAPNLPFSAASLEQFHKNFMLFSDILLRFCTADAPEKKLNLRRHDQARFNEFCTLLRKFNDSEIPVVLPCSDVMLPIMPAKRTPSDKDHNAFPLQDHYRIERLEEEITVFSSMARPKRASIVCRGSQGKKYGLMLKPKDDLRKDGRFLEVIQLLKKLLLQNDESRKRQLTMRSYMALPINDRSGVIEFVENLSALGDLITSMYKHRNVPNNRHKTTANMPQIKGRITDAQLPVLLKYFLEVALPASPSLFYDWFGVRFADPVAWYEARMAFTRTYAVAAMATYIMGIGDRHLENIMVDTTTGEVFNVDFECLFHKGETLPVAEVVPFRLTHNVVDAFGPLQCEGPFRKACEIALRIMQDEKDSVLNRCRTFLWDPFVEWKPQQGKPTAKTSRRSKAGDANVSSEDRFNFVARIVYAVIERKLSGYVRKFNPHEIGGRMGLMSKIPLSVEGQVDALIRDARDPRNLCRMFSGWSAFI